ncbi:MAG: PTS sugar transporter subunit IIC [Hespellia sp.]|nr:PTS sugar transporter subunit IIC [Hespellia sp.]
MIQCALLAALALFICYGGNWLIGQCMCERPIVVGMVAGLLLGDLRTGIIVGASLEAIFMGAVNIGGAIAAEPASATVLAVAFVTNMNMNQEAAVAVAVPVAVLSAVVSIFVNNVVLAPLAGLFDKIAADANERGLNLIHYGVWFGKYLIFAFIVFMAVYVGAEPVAALVNVIPDNVMAGMQACGGLLPAVGMALLMKMLWSKELAVFYFLGFVLNAYLGLPMIAIAVLGVIIALLTAMRDKELFDLRKSGVSVTEAVQNETNEEEDFFA